MAAGVPAEDPFSNEIRPVLDQYCAKCHGPLKMKGGVNFGPFTNAVSVYRDPALWRKAEAKLSAGEMPPEGKPQPTAAQRINLVQWIDARLKDLDQGRLPRDPGRVLIHRLSRTEYNCTIRDLFGVDAKPADKFPSEGGGGGGFDNNADTLFIPPILMERYLGAASDILDQAPHDTIFFTKSGLLTSERMVARKIIEHFAFLAFRRPVESDEVERYAGLYDRARQSGKAYEPAVKTALAAILVSPNFLFRIEHDQDGAEPFRINDYELASR
ncbi:MAG TPA: DUF1587 domain-containing protein, partial [Verrucomicrobiae bacterium]|nr:DUF1587 domain-containing protein [Verrucomicrobiae bacterium]